MKGKGIAWILCAFMWLASYMNSISGESGWFYEWFTTNVIVLGVLILVTAEGKKFFVDRDIKGAVLGAFFPLFIWGFAVVWGFTHDPTTVASLSDKGTTGIELLEEKSRVAEAPAPIKDTYYVGHWWDVKKGDYLYDLWSVFGWTKAGIPSLQAWIFWVPLLLTLFFFFGFLLTWANAKSAAKTAVSKSFLIPIGIIMLIVLVFFGAIWASMASGLTDWALRGDRTVTTFKIALIAVATVAWAIIMYIAGVFEKSEAPDLQKK